MDIVSSLTLLLGLVAYAAVSKRVDGSTITAPMLFVGFGVLFGPEALGLIRAHFSSETMKTLAELTLVFVLFTDSSKIRLTSLKAESGLPARLLGIALPLSIAAGFFAAAALFRDLTLWEALLLGVILAPTDAALGQAVVANERVPARIRQTLNVEAGLNDGICVPVLQFCVFAAVSAASRAQGIDQPAFLQLFSQAIGFGVLVGSMAGVLATAAFAAARRSGWVDRHWGMLGLLAVPAFCYLLAEHIGGSGFIAAFVAGLMMGNVRGSPERDTYTYAEASGDLLSYLTWTVFGAAVVGPMLHVVTLPIVGYALLSLTLLRMVPVAIALVGSRVSWQTSFFVGWFGPRGLASIVFAVVVLNESLIAGRHIIVDVVGWTIVLSVLLHGLTASAGASRYAALEERHAG